MPLLLQDPSGTPRLYAQAFNAGARQGLRVVGLCLQQQDAGVSELRPELPCSV